VIRKRSLCTNTSQSTDPCPLVDWLRYIPWKVTEKSFVLRVRRSFIDSSPDTVERTLKALIRANRFIQDKSNQDAVVNSLKKWLRIPPTQNIEDIYERMSLLYDRTIMPTRAGIQNALRVLSKADIKLAKLKADDLVDDRIARRLEKEGF
jgi:ABC-type nitrate/sulfonate/bicarbonate transport system substrate-binding protein